MQPRYNLLFREIERELLPLCAEEGIGVIPYNPLAGGLLTGKHQRDGAPTEGTRFTLGTAADRYQDRYWHDAEFDTVDAAPAARRRGRHVADAARRGVGAGQPDDHRADRRRQPPRAARRQPAGSRHSRSTPTSRPASTS